MGPVALSGRRNMRRLAAISVLGVIMLVATVVVAVGLLSGSSEQDLWFNGILFAGLWLYWGVGALVVLRADGHLVGWLFAVAAAMMASVILSFSLGFQLISSQQPDPLGAWFGLLGSLLLAPAIILALPAVALTFPTGTLPGPRWRWPVRLVAAMVAVRMLAIVIRPGPLFGDGDVPDNPLTPWLPTCTIVNGPRVPVAVTVATKLPCLTWPMSKVEGSVSCPRVK